MTQPVSVATCLWFDDQAEAAVEFYCALFPDARITQVNHQRGADGSPTEAAFIIAFELMGQSFTALNGGPSFKLSEAVSIQVNCDTQDEVDHYWQALSEGGKEVQCGWLKDRFGLSWQIVPRVLPRLLASPDAAQASRVMQAMMGMVKLDIAALEAAAKG